MKFHIDPPPVSDGNQNSTAQLASWLYGLADMLNVVLANLGYENFNKEVRSKLEGGRKQ